MQQYNENSPLIKVLLSTTTSASFPQPTKSLQDNIYSLAISMTVFAIILIIIVMITFCAKNQSEKCRIIIESLLKQLDKAASTASSAVINTGISASTAAISSIV